MVRKKPLGRSPTRRKPRNVIGSRLVKRVCGSCKGEKYVIVKEICSNCYGFGYTKYFRKLKNSDK